MELHLQQEVYLLVEPQVLFTTTEFVTIASQGNGIDYGDLTTASRNVGFTSDSRRAYAAGGFLVTNVIENILINSGGDFVDTGDLTISEDI